MMKSCPYSRTRLISCNEIYLFIPANTLFNGICVGKFSTNMRCWSSTRNATFVRWTYTNSCRSTILTTLWMSAWWTTFNGTLLCPFLIMMGRTHASGTTSSLHSSSNVAPDVSNVVTMSSVVSNLALHLFLNSSCKYCSRIECCHNNKNALFKDLQKIVVVWPELQIYTMCVEYYRSENALN